MTPRTGLEDDAGRVRELQGLLARYSLIRRDRNGETYWMHRLVAEVMRDRMGAAASEWRGRAMASLANCWPYVDFGEWPLCHSLLPHSLHLWTTVPAGAWEDQPSSLRLLNQWGTFLEAQRRYGEAEQLFRRTLEARERVLGAEHPATLISVNSFAYLYSSQGRYGEAEAMFQRVLEGLE